MNYKRIYDQLIQRGQDRVPNGYVERHHIVPLCMNGPDTKENKVALYPEEHFVAHALLLKIYKDTHYRYSLAKAVHKMTVGHDGKRVRRKLYGWLQREHALAMSETQKGEGNSQYGSFWVCNLKLKENRKFPNGSEIPEGWSKGRNAWNQRKNKGVGRGNAMSISAKEELAKRTRLNGNKISQGLKKYRLHNKKIWITDGIIEKCVSSDDPLNENFKMGRLKSRRIGVCG